MKIKRICSRNIGPTENIDIQFENNENNNPMPVILVGENGTGKSTLLSNIVDSFYEIAGVIYNNAKIREGENVQYYKIITPTEINFGHNYSMSYIEFEYNESASLCQYYFKSGELSYKDFSREINGELQNKNEWKEHQNIKGVACDKEKIKNDFEKCVCCYFGPERYEKPVWLGKDYFKTEENEHVKIKNKFDGTLDLPISQKSVSYDTLTWLLDVIVDSRTDIELIQGKLNVAHANVRDVLDQGIARKNIEQIMGAILGRDVYFGLNFRSIHGQRFNIFDKETEKKIVPTLDSLSTGQSALFNMFATIVRYADDKNISQSIKLENIEGIVVIDEIELHLHSKLQREVLPKLLRLFPKVQFIISTHSPLFLLGMDEQFGSDGYCIYQMPKGNRINSEAFSEFQNAFKYMMQTEMHRTEIENAIKTAASKDKKTLIITEGATDWRHLKAALKALKSDEDSKYSGLNIDFLEYDPEKSNQNDETNQSEVTKTLMLDMSCTQLVTMCKEFSKIRQPRKMIFIADADDNNTKKALADKNTSFKKWGNNVFSMILPIPEHRKDTPDVCIEHYYKDEDLKRSIAINDVPRQIYMGCEFNESGFSTDRKYFCTARNKIGKEKIDIIDGQSKSKVFRVNDESETNLALSKMAFAEAIYKEKEEMKGIDFSAFNLVFDAVMEIEKIELEI